MRDFLTLFGRPPTSTADAPGRANLLAEHTDYNGGFVLPTAIPQRSTVELAPRDGGRVRGAGAEPHGAAIRESRLRREQHGGDWLDYVQGCTVALARAGYRIGGFDARLR